tara:strand:- start:935 stop:1204 length:270 start_codon:yes stop_codon:yes gene_type:complete
MSRYDNTKIVEVDGKRVKQTTLYENVPKTNDDIYVMTQYGDRLDLLAHQFYGDSSLWWFIAKANNLKFNTVEIGTTLRIPSSIELAKGE